MQLRGMRAFAHADIVFPVFGHDPKEHGNGAVPAAAGFLAVVHASARLQRQHVFPDFRAARADSADEQERGPGLFAGVVGVALGT